MYTCDLTGILVGDLYNSNKHIIDNSVSSLEFNKNHKNKYSYSGITIYSCIVSEAFINFKNNHTQLTYELNKSFYIWNKKYNYDFNNVKIFGLIPLSLLTKEWSECIYYMNKITTILNIDKNDFNLALIINHICFSLRNKIANIENIKLFTDNFIKQNNIVTNYAFISNVTQCFLDTKCFNDCLKIAIKYNIDDKLFLPIVCCTANTIYWNNKIIHNKHIIYDNDINKLLLKFCIYQKSNIPRKYLNLKPIDFHKWIAFNKKQIKIKNSNEYKIKKMYFK